MPVSKLTLKYCNKMISNVYSLSQCSLETTLGQVLCQLDVRDGAAAALPASQGLTGHGTGEAT